MSPDRNLGVCRARKQLGKALGMSVVPRWQTEVLKDAVRCSNPFVDRGTFENKTWALLKTVAFVKPT